jgi:hypothetical protein
MQALSAFLLGMYSPVEHLRYKAMAITHSFSSDNIFATPRNKHLSQTPETDPQTNIRNQACKIPSST